MSVSPAGFFLAFLQLFLACDSKKPEVTVDNRIVDSADMLTPVQEDSLREIIRELESDIGSQMALLTLDTLNGEKIEQYSLHYVEEMGLGRAKYNDGLLITISLKDRKARIEVGTGLEKILKDEIAARILREQLTPSFRNKKYYNGLKEAMLAIRDSIKAHPSLVGN